MSQGPPLAGRRILVVEDEVVVAWMLEDILGELGCAVVGPAANVADALALIAAEAIDAAVVDLKLHGAWSYPIADLLVARGVPFAFATGYDRSVVSPGYQAFVVLEKPFKPGLVREALERLLAAGEAGGPPVIPSG